ncbi:MAG TPA: hypothetical protein VMY05_01605 [Acidobacteriota bacterium]|nr:hypothetical protein [Acidobacteriota bacterium]
MFRASLFAGILAGLVLAVVLGGCSGPDSVEELQAAGQKAFLQQDYATARDYFLRGVAKEPSNKDLLYYAGMSYKRDFLYDSALFYLKRLDILYPNDRETNRQLYEIALALEDWDYARTALTGLVRTGDRIEDHYADYAELWGKDNHPGNAYYYTKLAIEVEPDNPTYYMQAAVLATTVEPGPAAMAWVDTAIARFGESDPFLGTKALILAKQESYREAERIYRDLATRDTTNVLLQVNLAHTLAAQDDVTKKTEALEIYRSTAGIVSRDLKLDSLIEELEQELKRAE